MAIPTHSLTTLARVKDRLSITSNGADEVLERFIATATAYVEAECNRRFLRTTYTDEIYSVLWTGVDSIMLKQAPVTALTSISYRTGLVSTPTWTAYTANDYELQGDGKAGIVIFYGAPASGNNNIKVTYTAGYLIDFANATDTTKHTLPFDITDLCERLVVKMWKRRESEGKSSESFQGGEVTWAKLIDSFDESILSHHRRIPVFY